MVGYELLIFLVVQNDIKVSF